MSEKATAKATGEISLTKVLRDELNHLKPELISKNASLGEAESADEQLNEVFADFHRAKLSALCFSGGGIRSATFGLGIVQALAKNGLLDKFDYLSTVSGGGYLGAWLSAWIRREQINYFENQNRFSDEQLFEKYNAAHSIGITAVQGKLNDRSIPKPLENFLPSPNPEPKQLQFLREYSNYMSPKVGLLSADTWTFLGIYTRNLFLNWTIFIPLICAVLLIPRILLAFINLPANERSSSLILLAGLLGGIVGVASTVHKLPSKILDGEKIRYNTDFGVFATVILPMLLMAFAATTFWARLQTSEKVFEIPSEWLRRYLGYEAVNFILYSTSIFVVGNLVFCIYKKLSSGKFNIRAGEFVSAFLSSAVGGFLTWLIAHNFFGSAFFAKTLNYSFNLPIYVCLAVPLYLLCFSVSSNLFVGLYSRVATDADREWLARQGAWVLIVCGAWMALNGLVLFGPIAFEKLISATGKLFGNAPDLADYFTPLVPIIAAISGFISLVGGFSGQSKVRNEPTKSKLSKFLAVAPKIAAVIFLAFIFIVLAYVSGIVLTSTGNFIGEFSGEKANGLAFAEYSHLRVLYQSSNSYLLIWLIVLSAVGAVMSCFVNVNKFSLHAAYRDRLIRAYLGASRIKRAGNTFTGFDDADNFQMHRLKGQKPFHIINATLNLVAGKNLAWQNRKAASFTMSPLHCGSWRLGYRNTNEYCRNTNLPPCRQLRYCNERKSPCPSVKECRLQGKALRLGTAMTISGAAANPNMGYYSSPVVTFLMALFNIRLGWWLGNTGAVGDKTDVFGDPFYTKPSPSNAVFPLLNETLGRTDENKRFLNVTDGGHFENLGLYEMVLRRCRLIVLSDAAADENFTFSEISNAVEKCKVDLGVCVEFKGGIHISARHTAEEPPPHKKRFAIAEIIYPEKNQKGENHKGILLYIRPTFYGDEPTEIRHYARVNKTFPHQSTADQFYDEKQFEAYRALGSFIAEAIIETKSAAALFNMLKNY